MSESTVTAAPAAPPPPKQDRGLKVLLWVLVAITVIVLGAFSVVYYLGQRVEAPPSIAQKALTQAEAAVKASPNDIGLRLQLANSYIAESRPDDALVQFQEVLSAQPENRAALLGAGMMLFQKGELALAKPLYEQFIDTSGTGEFAAADPQLEQALYYLGSINLSLNDIPAAVTSLRDALAIDKTDADAWYLLGEAQSRDGKFPEAVEAYRQALLFVPSGWCEPYEGLDKAFAEVKDTDGQTYAKGMASICRGSGTDGVDALASLTSGKYQLPALLGLGLAAENSGDTDKAIDYYNQAVEVDSANITARTALARLGAPQNAAPSASPSASGSEK